MRKLIADYSNGKLGSFAQILIILCISTALFTYSGASIEAENFTEKARASVFSLASGAAIFMFWDIIIKIAPNLKTGKRKVLASLIIICGCMIIFWLSSALNVAGLAGRNALELHLNHYNVTLEAALDKKFNRSLLIKSVIADLRMEQTRYLDVAREEFKNGAYSGIKGPGAVVSALNNIANRLGNLLEEAENYLTGVRKVNGQSLSRLEKIRNIISSDKSLPRRMRDVAKESAALRAELAEINIKNFSGSVTRTFGALPRTIDVISTFSSDKRVAARQKKALSKVRADIEQTGDLLTALMGKIEALEPLKIHPFEKITAVRAVMVYWINFMPYWAGGIGLDIAPLILVLFLQIGISSKTTAQLARDQMLGMTVEEIIRGKLNEETLRRSAIDNISLKNIIHELVGKDEIPNEKEGEE